MFTFFIIGLFLMENVERILLAICSSNPQTSKSCSLKENPCSLERYLIILSEIYSSTPSIAIEGVDEYISERIIKYRSKLQGFSFKEQLFEVWGLDEQMANKILSTFSIKNKPIIKKVNINTASFKEVLSNPYIDYELCIQIFDYKDEVAELQSISEIKNIEGFPIKKYNRIVLYLLAE